MAKKYVKSLIQQLYCIITSMMAIGESRHLDKMQHTTANKIYSFNTRNLYYRVGGYYVNWLKEHFPECTSIKASKKYCNIWFNSLVVHGYSAFTIATYVSAINKILQIRPNDPHRFHPPARRRADISRSRNPVAMDQHFSPIRNKPLIDFACATGTRRNVLERVIGDDLWSRDRMEDALHNLERITHRTPKETAHYDALKTALETFADDYWFLHHRRDKGGRCRFSPIIGPNQQSVVAMLQKTGKYTHVFPSVSAAADIHSYRASYAMMLYKMSARDIDSIPKNGSRIGSRTSGVYVCRRELAGVRLDRLAMKTVSIALGHNRITIFAQNYYRHN